MSAAAAVSVMGVSKALPATHGILSWLRHRGTPPRRAILSDVSFTVERGELFGLLGPNGAGKSTLLRMLAGLIHTDAGSIAIDGHDISAGAPERRKAIGFCTGEERSFHYRLSARSNLAYFGALAGLRFRDLPERIEAIARTVDLDRDLDRRFDGFSAGMRQRLAFARALLADPDVVLLDEPTRAVDPVHAHELRRFVRDELVTTLGKTVIIATNLLDEAWELCDRVAVLRAGRIVSIAKPAELGQLASPVRRYAIDLDRAEASFLERVRLVPGLISLSTTVSGSGVKLSVDLDDDPQTLTELLRAVSANGVAVTHVQPENPRPIDVFTRLTGLPDDAR